MNLVNEGLPQKGVISSEIQSEIEGKNIKITMRILKTWNKKPVEKVAYFTLNGLNALIGSLQAQALWLEEHDN